MSWYEVLIFALIFLGIAGGLGWWCDLLFRKLPDEKEDEGRSPNRQN